MATYVIHLYIHYHRVCYTEVSFLLIYVGAENFEEKDIQVETGDKECKEQIHTLDCSKEGIDDGCQLQNTEMSPITPFEYRRHVASFALICYFH